ncbi:class I SAM-dependent methyltransferase [Nocardia sp. NPDC020380]|uniref:class I SAM-dependent methyltransferase n=1 Tax=Nocardia sp. NPDC020380 TaxID=3364309 RepID=UPI0037A220F3
MVTLPPEPARPDTPEPHRYRQMAESFGVDSARYDRTRQPYPEALIKRIAAASPGPGPEILDVGCGTGIAARQFRTEGCTVLGVEPDPRMADFARNTGIPVETATFETWDPATRTFDAVIAGTAWHWVDPDQGIPKLAKLLRPNGRFAAFWHIFEPPAAVQEVITAAFRRVLADQTPPDATAVLRGAGSARHAYDTFVTRVADQLRATGQFTEPEEWRHTWQRPYTRDEYLDQIPTMGAFTRLQPTQLEQLLTAAGKAIDQQGGTFTMDYTTLAITAARNHE